MTTTDVALRDAPYRDPHLPVSLRVGDLLSRMTLDEKVAQLAAMWLNEHDGDYAAFECGAAVERLAAIAPHGIGGFTRPFGSGPLPVPDAARLVNALQRWLVEKTRLGIPALVHEECLTGFMAAGTTSMPSPLALGATFDPDVVEKVGAVIGAELAAAGVHQGLAPVLDVARDQRWGRVEECIGEDPWLVGTLGAAYVRGMQSAGVAATGKHFVAHAAGEGGHNAAGVHAGWRELADVHLVPFEMAIRTAGLLTVMSAYHDIDGVPVSADRDLLTTILRERWRWDGVVVSDYWALDLLVAAHRVAATTAEAGVLAAVAGVDMELPNPSCYADLVRAVRGGVLDEAVVDRSVRHVLMLKFRLGLFEQDFTEPPGSVGGVAGAEVARAAAAESLVLLQNNGVLPLRPDAAAVAVIGANGDDHRALLGNYGYLNHVAYRFPASRAAGLRTVLDAVRDRVSPTTVVRAHPGVPLTEADSRASRRPVDEVIADAADVARGAEVTIVVVGDRPGHFGRGTVGEGTDRDRLTLPGEQERLVEAVAATGTPVVVVLTSGRAAPLRGVARGAAAVLQAWFAGQEGAAAVVAALFGDDNPGGRTPITFAGDAGQQPAYYTRGAGARQDYLGSPVAALYPFGHGLSYTTFDYDDLRCDEVVPTHGRIRVSCVVRNIGDRTGDEVVQLYVRDDVASVVRPERALRGLRRVRLAPGEAARVSFDLSTDAVAAATASLRRPEPRHVVEPGTIQVLVGASSEDVRLRATVTLSGPPRDTGDQRDLLCRTDVSPAADPTP